VKEVRVPATAQQIYGRYVRAGAISRDADALAEMFTEDGVLDSPLVPAGHPYPRRLEGREAIREAMAAFYRRTANDVPVVDLAKTRYVLHLTADPEVFIAEIDTAFEVPGGTETASFVQIFRVRDGKITMLRDYFPPSLVG
jgi:ketosteroid isomerase-like protein